MEDKEGMWLSNVNEARKEREGGEAAEYGGTAASLWCIPTIFDDSLWMKQGETKEGAEGREEGGRRE